MTEATTPTPTATPNTRGGVVRRLFREAGSFKGRLVLIALVDLAAAPLALLLPLALKVAVDSVIGDQPLPGFMQPFFPDWVMADATRLLVAVAVLQVLAVLLVQVQGLGAYVLRTHVGEHLTLQFRSRLFRHVQRLSLAYHDQRGATDSLYRIQYDAPAIQWITVYGVMQLFGAVATLGAMVFVISRIDLTLALVALLVCVPLYVLNGRYNRTMRPRYKEVAGVESAAFAVVNQTLSAMRVVLAFGREDREHDRFVEQSSQWARQQVRLSFAESVFGLLVNLTTAIGTAVVLFLGVQRVQDGQLTLGELLLVMAYLAALYQPLTSVSEQIATLQSALASAERAFELLDTLPDVEDRPDARSIDRATGRIELRDVAYSYDGERRALDGVNLDVAPGTRLGIAGRTGSGKTTLVNLMARFYDPLEGEVLLDGQDLRDLRLADVRNQFAIVLQEPVLFPTTIAENIAFARPEATLDEIIAAATAANAHDFISALPDRYDTVVGERGQTLSGGERQRVSIARAFLKDAPILLLDEPTSALDTATEATIMDAMDRLMQGRTTLMIAHRLSTLEMCDRVIELDHGRLMDAT